VRCSEPCPLSLLCLQERLDADNKSVCDCGICPMCGKFWVSFYTDHGKYGHHEFVCPERRITAAQIWRWLSRFRRKPDGDLREAIANDTHVSIRDTMYLNDRGHRRSDKGYIQVAPCHAHHHLRYSPALEVARAYIKEKYGDQAA